MNKRATFYFLVGVFITPLSTYAFFADWTKMPMQMMNGMTQPQAQQPVVCDCRCK